MLRKTLKLLGSLNLALLLLALLIIACVIGTLCETHFNAEVARTYVYGASWFTSWLLLLVVNLISAAAVRFPWRRDQYAFVITHAGIVIILFGGLLDRRWGVEGSIRLKEGDPPVKCMMVPGEELQVELDGVQGTGRTPFQKALLKGNSAVSFGAASPAADVRVDVVDAKPLRPREAGVEPCESGLPAIKWRFRSPSTGQQEEVWLFAGQMVKCGDDAVVRFADRAARPLKEWAATLDLTVDDAGQLQYRRSFRAGTASGPVEIGKEIPLQWGADSVFAVDRFIPQGRRALAWSPSDDPEDAPGLRCRIEVAGESALVWVGPRVKPEYFPWQKVKVGGRNVRLRIGNPMVELPFSLELVKFDAPYHEGLESMGRFAKFESVLRFNGLEGSEQTASMNNPATYPQTWWGPFLGTSYRISQSSHEKPDYPDVSIVGVIRDPGWFPKWFGSLLVCLGIFATFYLRRSPARGAATPETSKAP